MKKTQKYSKACQILTFSHQTQDELYTELNRLGWWWQSDKKEWERNDTPPKEASKLIEIRVWTATKKVEQAAELFIEKAEEMGLRLIKKSKPYQCRPPEHLDSRVYLVFEDIDT